MIHSHALVLDGGLATELERRGNQLGGHLWSAEWLLHNSAVIRDIHRAYFLAGSDIGISASYQASLAGFSQAGHDRPTYERCLKSSVQLVREAAELAATDGVTRQLQVAASVGPYGATLANGAEFTGDYDIDEPQLVQFHLPRLQLLLEAAPDYLAIETIPSAAELRALARVLDQVNNLVPAWISVSCRDSHHLSDGTPLADCYSIVADIASLVAIGVNCVHPDWVHTALTDPLASAPVAKVVYPNRGETWDFDNRCWLPDSGQKMLATQVSSWYQAGARFIGGCCRTTPDDIRLIRDTIDQIEQDISQP